MVARDRLAIILSILSLALLWPGLVQPALTISVSVELFGTTREIAHETRSVVGAVRSLHASGNDFVAGLILLFSVVVPLLKAAMLTPATDPAVIINIRRFYLETLYLLDDHKLDKQPVAKFRITPKRGDATPR